MEQQDEMNVEDDYEELDEESKKPIVESNSGTPQSNSLTPTRTGSLSSRRKLQQHSVTSPSDSSAMDEDYEEHEDEDVEIEDKEEGDEEDEGEEGEEGEEEEGEGEEQEEEGEENEEGEEEEEEEEEEDKKILIEEEEYEDEEYDSDIDSMDLELSNDDKLDPTIKIAAIAAATTENVQKNIDQQQQHVTQPTQLTSQSTQLLTQDNNVQQQPEQLQPKEEYQYFETGLPGDDYLVPIRLEIFEGYYKLSDTLLWNLNEKSITPSQYVHRLCIELDYPEGFENSVVSSLTNQIKYHRDIMKDLCKLLPLFDNAKEFLVTIVLDLSVNGLYLKDKFQWDLFGCNSPEAFARSLCVDYGLSREYESTISFSIREQIQYHLHTIVNHPQPIKYITRIPIKAEMVFRSESELSHFTPLITHNKAAQPGQKFFYQQPQQQPQQQQPQQAQQPQPQQPQQQPQQQPIQYQQK